MCCAKGSYPFIRNLSDTGSRIEQDKYVEEGFETIEMRWKRHRKDFETKFRYQFDKICIEIKQRCYV